MRLAHRVPLSAHLSPLNSAIGSTAAGIQTQSIAVELFLIVNRECSLTPSHTIFGELQQSLANGNVDLHTILCQQACFEEVHNGWSRDNSLGSLESEHDKKWTVMMANRELQHTFRSVTFFRIALTAFWVSIALA
jgi:hypothetical protein